MADHFYSPEARRDLLEIWEYIATDNVDPRNQFAFGQSIPT